MVAPAIDGDDLRQRELATAGEAELGPISRRGHSDIPFKNSQLPNPVPVRSIGGPLRGGAISAGLLPTDLHPGPHHGAACLQRSRGY
jgi:hypothetical protein